VKTELLRVAELELADAIAYYEGEQEGLGQRFLREVERTLGQIESMPLAWPTVS